MSPAPRSSFSCVSAAAEPSSDLCSSENTSLVSWFRTEPLPTHSTVPRPAAAQARCLLPGCLCPARPHTHQPVGSTQAQEAPAALPQTESEEGKQRTEGREDTNVVWRVQGQRLVLAQAVQTLHRSKGGISWGLSQSKGRFFTEISPRESIWLPKSRSCCLIPRQRS